MTGALEINKKRMGLMIGLVGAAMIVAVAGAYGAFVLQAPWGLPAFVIAIAAGFAAQFWFIAAVMKRGRS